MMTLVFGMLLPWLLIAVATWLEYQLIRQNGRILLRLEAIERQLGARAPAPRQEPAGLPVGAVAPDFELPDLAGARRKLSEFRGRDVLLIFFNPKCGFCTKMTTDLAALPIEGGGRDRKSTRLNSSHLGISYAVFCHHCDLHSCPTRRSSDLRSRPGCRSARSRRTSNCRTSPGLAASSPSFAAVTCC